MRATAPAGDRIACRRPSSALGLTAREHGAGGPHTQKPGAGRPRERQRAEKSARWLGLRRRGAPTKAEAAHGRSRWLPPAALPGTEAHRRGSSDRGQGEPAQRSQRAAHQPHTGPVAWRRTAWCRACEHTQPAHTPNPPRRQATPDQGRPEPHRAMGVCEVLAAFCLHVRRGWLRLATIGQAWAACGRFVGWPGRRWRRGVGWRRGERLEAESPAGGMCQRPPAAQSVLATSVSL